MRKEGLLEPEQGHCPCTDIPITIKGSVNSPKTHYDVSS